MNKKNISVGIFIIVVFLGILYFSNSEDSGHFYTNTDAAFSMQIPKGWTLEDQSQSTTSISVWFSDPTLSEGETAIRIGVTRYTRTSEINKVINMFGEYAFLEAVAGDVTMGLDGFKETMNATTTTDGKLFVKVFGIYTGANSQKEITQQLYLTITDDSYYLIGIDAYSDIWEKNMREILRSIDTFKLL